MAGSPDPRPLSAARTPAFPVPFPGLMVHRESAFISETGSQVPTRAPPAQHRAPQQANIFS